jgi:hypothetical protein
MSESLCRPASRVKAIGHPTCRRGAFAALRFRQLRGAPGTTASAASPEIKMLERLAHDADANVRDAARTALKTVAVNRRFPHHEGRTCQRPLPHCLAAVGLPIIGDCWPPSWPVTRFA